MARARGAALAAHCGDEEPQWADVEAVAQAMAVAEEPEPISASPLLQRPFVPLIGQTVLQLAKPCASDEEEPPECPICMGFLCEPLTAACGHSFCRLCLLEAGRLAPSAGSCPLCRGTLDVAGLAGHPVDKALEARVLALVPLEDYEARRRDSRQQVDAARRNVQALPVFWMAPGCRTGSLVMLHLFEPRYRLLARRVWEGTRMFVFCNSVPQEGCQGILIRVSSADFLPDGRADVLGRAIRTVTVQRRWVEPNSEGLFYAEVDVHEVQGRPMSPGAPLALAVAAAAAAAVPTRAAVAVAPRPNFKCGCPTM